MSSTAAQPTALYEIDDAIATITINRPEVRNALCPAMTAALLEATANAERDARARCVILRGAGECFTGGGDIPAYAAAIDRDADEYRTDFARQVADWHLIVARLRTMPKPVLACVHGVAFGFGLSLVAASDLAIAADSTMFLLPHRHIALPPDAGLSYFLPRLVGERRALEMALLGGPFDAAKALDLGIVNWTVSLQDLSKQTDKIARQLASGPPLGLGKAKALIRSSFDHDFQHQIAEEVIASRAATETTEHIEGVAALVEKRRPQYL